jgi:hypothetical protein
MFMCIHERRIEKKKKRNLISIFSANTDGGYAVVVVVVVVKFFLPRSIQLFFFPCYQKKRAVALCFSSMFESA